MNSVHEDKLLGINPDTIIIDECISKYPKDYIPPEAKVITGIDRANGDSETYVVEGFIDTDGSIHLQSIFNYDIVMYKSIR